MTFKAYQYESPLTGLSEKELSELRTDFGKQQEKIYQESLDRIIEVLAKYNPLSLLATLSFYGLTTTTGENDEFKKENPILQHHIEIIQTILLTLDPSKIGLDIPDSYIVQEMFDLGRKVTRGFFLKRIKDISTYQDFTHMQAIEDIRIHTQAVRNPTYPEQWHRINYGVLFGINTEFKEIFGIEATTLYDTFMSLVCLIENRISTYFRKLKSVGSRKNSNDLIDEFLHQFQEMGYKKEDILNAKNLMNVRDKDMKYFIMQYSDPSLIDCYKLSIADLKKQFPPYVTDSQIINIFDHLSYKVGDLNNIDKGLIFMNNPIWEKPVIKIDESIYYWPLPSLVFSFSLKMFEGLMSGYEDLFNKYILGRSSYLENEIEELFKKYFPDAQIFRGSKWVEDGEEYENDLTVILENYMLVIEAKSGKVSDSARRGGALRLKKEINKILVEPAKQARRFERYLINTKKSHEFNTKSGNINRIDTTNIIYHECITVCLEQFGKLNTSWKLLEKAKFIDDKIKLTPSIFLGDLYILLDALEGQAQKIHYLFRRVEFETNANFEADEIDLLVLYLDNGFNIGGAEFSGQVLQMYGISNELDVCYARNPNAENTKRPKRKLSRLWVDIVKQIESRKKQGWLRIAYILYNVQYDDQKEIEKSIKKLYKYLNRQGPLGKKDHAVFLTNGPEQRRDGLVFIGYKKLTKDERLERLRVYGEEILEMSKSKDAVVVAFDIKKPIYPYNVIALIG